MSDHGAQLIAEAIKYVARLVVVTYAYFRSQSYSTYLQDIRKEMERF